MALLLKSPKVKGFSRGREDRGVFAGGLGLIKDIDYKIYLLLYCLCLYYAKSVVTWLKKYKRKTEVFILPVYVSGLNFTAYLNYNLKAGIKIVSPAKNKKSCKES